MTKQKSEQSTLAALIEWLISLFLGSENEDDKSNATSRGDDSPPPYAVRPSMLSDAERQFDRFLVTCVEDPRVSIHRKVRVADILQVVPGSPRWQHWFNRISSKHADFVLCLSQRPVAVIELDDKSHNSKRRADRDEFIDSAYTAACLPILHVKVARSYDRDVVSRFVSEAVRQYEQQ